MRCEFVDVGFWRNVFQEEVKSVLIPPQGRKLQIRLPIPDIFIHQMLQSDLFCLSAMQFFQDSFIQLLLCKLSLPGIVELDCAGYCPALASQRIGIILSADISTV